MCLGVPARIVDLGDVSNPLAQATVEIQGQQRGCSMAYLPEAEIGDFVLIQNGFATTLLSPQEAQETLDALEDYRLLDSDSPLLARPTTNRSK